MDKNFQVSRLKKLDLKMFWSSKISRLPTLLLTWPNVMQIYLYRATFSTGPVQQCGVVRGVCSMRGDWCLVFGSFPLARWTDWIHCMSWQRRSLFSKNLVGSGDQLKVLIILTWFHYVTYFIYYIMKTEPRILWLPVDKKQRLWSG